MLILHLTCSQGNQLNCRILSPHIFSSRNYYSTTKGNLRVSNRVERSRSREQESLFSLLFILHRFDTFLCLDFTRRIYDKLPKTTSKRKKNHHRRFSLLNIYTKKDIFSFHKRGREGERWREAKHVDLSIFLVFDSSPAFHFKPLVSFDEARCVFEQLERKRKIFV